MTAGSKNNHRDTEGTEARPTYQAALRKQKRFRSRNEKQISSPLLALTGEEVEDRLCALCVLCPLWSPFVPGGQGGVPGGHTR